MSLLTPTLLRQRITDITPEDLRALGARGVLLDVDNTLTTHYNPELPADIAAWLAERQKEGFRFTLVSNAKRRRVEPFAAKLGMSCTWLAGKPLPGGYRRAARRMGLSPRDCVAVGDQIFTDTLGARLAGMRCIQLDPIRLEEGKPFLMFKRRLEEKLLRRMRKKEEKR